MLPPSYSGTRRQGYTLTFESVPCGLEHVMRGAIVLVAVVVVHEVVPAKDGAILFLVLSHRAQNVYMRLIIRFKRHRFAKNTDVCRDIDGSFPFK